MYIINEFLCGKTGFYAIATHSAAHAVADAYFIGYKAVDVQFYMTLMQLIELNEREQYLTTSVMMTFTWKDEYLMWRPEMNAGITEITVPSSKIWVPDVLLYNRYSD